jgi:hypothetical protein
MIHAAQSDPDVPVMLFHTLQDGPAVSGVRPTEEILAGFSASLFQNLSSALLSGVDAYLSQALQRAGLYDAINQGFGVFAANGAPKPAAARLQSEFSLGHPTYQPAPANLADLSLRTRAHGAAP